MSMSVTPFESLGAIWEETPAILNASPLAELYDENLLFTLACSAADRWRNHALADMSDVRVLTETGSVTPGFLSDRLPNRSDRDFHTYLDRASEKGSDFNLTINSLQQFSPQLFDRLVHANDLVLRLAKTTPGGISDCHMIAGVYREAPTRVHKDTASVITMVVSGTKRFYLWPFEFFADIAGPQSADQQTNLDIDYRLWIEDATVLDLRAGDLAYWPSSYWHCATSDGMPHVSLHIANYMVADPAAELAFASRSILERNLEGTPTIANHARRPDGAAVLTESWREALRELAGSNELEIAVRARVLKRTSTANFEVVPTSASDESPGLDQLVDGIRRPSLDEFCLARSGVRVILLCCMGQVVQLVGRAGLADFLSSLYGLRSTINHIQKNLKALDADLSADEALRIISLMLRVGVLETVDYA